MNADVLTATETDGIAIITLGSVKHIYFDAEMGDALTEALDGFAGDPKVRVVIVTGGAPGYFNRHFSIPALIQIAESLRASDRQWPENATYNGGFFDKAMALCESMPKPVIAAISGTALAGAFEFALACDLRIAEEGDYLIGFPETELGLLPGAGGTQRLPRTIGMPAALMHNFKKRFRSSASPCASGVSVALRTRRLIYASDSGVCDDRRRAISIARSIALPVTVSCTRPFLSASRGLSGRPMRMCSSAAGIPMVRGSR